jgi:phosphoserine phosphatase
MTLFILVRHGQTEWNRVERFRGRADVPLDQTGLDQAAATGQRIAAEWRPAAIYSSPMVRTMQTAGAIGEYLRMVAEPHGGLVDIDFGQWQGLTPEEARAQWPEMVDAWYHTPQNAQPPGGETLSDLRRRATAMLDELAARHREQSIVLVGHTVINRVILLAVLGLGNDRFWRLAQDTCAINVFERRDGDYGMIKLNDTCHLHPANSA